MWYTLTVAGLQYPITFPHPALEGFRQQRTTHHELSPSKLHKSVLTDNDSNSAMSNTKNPHTHGAEISVA